MARYSYFQDFTDKEREAMFQKMKERGQTWKEILNRFGHPKDWEELKPKQLEML